MQIRLLERQAKSFTTAQLSIVYNSGQNRQQEPCRNEGAHIDEVKRTDADGMHARAGARWKGDREE